MHPLGNGGFRSFRKKSVGEYQENLIWKVGSIIGDQRIPGENTKTHNHNIKKLLYHALKGSISTKEIFMTPFYLWGLTA